MYKLTSLLMLCAFLIVSAGCAHRTGDKPRIIIMTDAGTVYRGFVRSEHPDPQDLRDMVEQCRRGGVDTLSFCVHSRWQAYYDSKVVEIAGDLSPPAVQPWNYTHYWAWLAVMRRLVEQGDDPPRIVAEACRRRGMRCLAYFRMNDTHGIKPHEGQYGSFRREHPEWAIDGSKSMDYGVPQVRQHILSVVQEVVDRYDIDGIDFDFMRHPRFFKGDQIQANTPVMTGFIGEVRAILDEAGEKKGRRMLLNVRVPQTLEGCENVGLDVRTWVRDELVDTICPASFYYTHWDNMIRFVGEWRELVEPTECGFYPTIHYGAHEPNVRPPWLTSASYRGAAFSYLRSGADGIALYNIWNMNNAPAWEAVADMRSVRKLNRQPRRYHCNYGSFDAIEKGRSRDLDFYLFEDPQVPGLNAHLRFYAPNLTLDHKIELDINGTAIDLDTVIFRRNKVGAFFPRPVMEAPYGHMVLIPLASTTTARVGQNKLTVRLIESNPEIRSLPAYIKVTASEGGIAACFVEALYNYRELPRVTQPGSYVGGEPVGWAMENTW